MVLKLRLPYSTSFLNKRFFMKKIISLISIVLLLSSFSLSAQENVSVPVSDTIYDFLDLAQTKRLCKPLNGFKPYSKKQIVSALEEINENKDSLTEKEAQIVQQLLEKYTFEDDEKQNNLLSAHAFEYDDTSVSLNYYLGFEATYSGGVYSKSDYNSFGMDNIFKIAFDGDIGEKLSYRIKGDLDLSKIPLKEVGKYFIGYPWYDGDVQAFLDGVLKEGDEKYDVSSKARYIRKYLINSYLPYSYKKPWSGQFYYLSNMNASGLEGWATQIGIGFTVDGEIRGTLLNDKIMLGIGRVDREVAAMDNGSSLVLNSHAYPFMAADVQFKIFDFLKFYSLTGILEYPNQDYINAEALSKFGENGNNDDSFYFQNAFSLNMVELDYKGLHVDFGGTAVFPKRFELGYVFPLVSYVEYQNHIGDCDNLSLFGDLKYTWAGIASLWGSLYLDELNGLNNNPFTSTRAMFAIQGGVKYIIPDIPFANVSFRYTRIEPYCYTHHSINYTPWYSHYICENYSNNGESLGYYLPPNSDEFLLSFKMKPSANVSWGASYQLIRHGADYGSQQVPGSNIYSELSNLNRSQLKKYFLHDGAYNWNHIVSAGGRITLNTKFPVSFYGNLGVLYSYFTVINYDDYDRSVYGNNGNCKNASFKTPYKIADTDEYPNLFGGVVTVGASVRF